MPSLIDLPAELLILILEEVGGRELRRKHGGNKLVVCRKWYQIAHPIYVAGLEFSKIRVFGHNTGGVKGKFELVALNRKYGYAQIRRHLQRNTRQLRLRLLGHWWDETTAATTTEQNGNDWFYENEGQQNEPPIPFQDETGKQVMAYWRNKTLKLYMDELFVDLHDFTALEHLVIEFSSEVMDDRPRGPHWDYIYHSTISRLLRNLPILHDLSSFTLDICGTCLVEEDLEDHLCVKLAEIIPRIEHVRLRMRRICPTIFKIDRGMLSEPRVKSIVLKLHLPMFKDVNNLWSDPCWQMVGSRSGSRLHQRMARASQSFLASLSMIRSGRSQEDVESGVAQKQSAACHGMAGFRMTYADASSPCLGTIDFLAMRRLSFEEEFFAFEDDGAPCWFELSEEGKRMRDDGPFVFGHT